MNIKLNYKFAESDTMLVDQAAAITNNHRALAVEISMRSEHAPLITSPHLSIRDMQYHNLPYHYACNVVSSYGIGLSKHQEICSSLKEILLTCDIELDDIRESFTIAAYAYTSDTRGELTLVNNGAVIVQRGSQFSIDRHEVLACIQTQWGLILAALQDVARIQFQAALKISNQPSFEHQIISKMGGGFELFAPK